jgi:dTDP-4-dehydrorhamnose 3,5-epimerase
MTFIDTPIKDLFVIQPKIWEDERGYFYESYSEKRFEDKSIFTHFVQDNQSLSQTGTLRGLHAQTSPFEQGKLVRVIQGKVLDVAVDIRKNSATFGQHFTVELGGDTHKMLWIPPGFLHGFITLEDNTIFTYKVTNLYNKDLEIGLRWDDPDLGIEWQLDRTKIILSEKDKALPAWKEFESPF